MANEQRLIKANVLEQLRYTHIVQFLNGRLIKSLPLSEAPTVDAISVVRCRNCVLHGNCSTEDAFNFAKINDPFCCAGKEKS